MLHQLTRCTLHWLPAPLLCSGRITSAYYEVAGCGQYLMALHLYVKSSRWAQHAAWSMVQHTGCEWVSGGQWRLCGERSTRPFAAASSPRAQLAKQCQQQRTGGCPLPSPPHPPTPPSLARSFYPHSHSYSHSHSISLSSEKTLFLYNAAGFAATKTLDLITGQTDAATAGALSNVQLSFDPAVTNFLQVTADICTGCAPMPPPSPPPRPPRPPPPSPSPPSKKTGHRRRQQRRRYRQQR